MWKRIVLRILYKNIVIVKYFTKYLLCSIVSLTPNLFRINFLFCVSERRTTIIKFNKEFNHSLSYCMYCICILYPSSFPGWMPRMNNFSIPLLKWMYKFLIIFDVCYPIFCFIVFCIFIKVENKTCRKNNTVLSYKFCHYCCFVYFL